MSETPDRDDALIERLVRDARPNVDPAARDRWLFEAGRAAGRRERGRWTNVWATAACLFAATTLAAWTVRPSLESNDSEPVAREIDRAPIDPPPERVVIDDVERPRPTTVRAFDRRLPEWRPANTPPEVARSVPPPLVPLRARWDLDSL